MSRILAITPTYNEILNIGDLIDSIFSLDMMVESEINSTVVFIEALNNSA